jgi:hypothetical protein
LPHGQWLPWLKANAEELGFENRRTASRLMAAARKWGASAPLGDPTAALAVNRVIHGHADSQLVQQSLSNEH